MMRALVVADTHMPRAGRALPAALVEELSRVDAVFHLGDFTGIEVVEALSRHARLYAVHGNNDSADIQSLYPAEASVTWGGRLIHLIHGHVGGKTALEAARNVRHADVVLFGHSHRPFQGIERGTVLFNPGSPTDKRWGPIHSFGIMTVDADVHLELVTV